MVHTIPGPLQDRMEIIDVSGYVLEEKKAIAEVGHVVLTFLTYAYSYCNSNILYQRPGPVVD